MAKARSHRRCDLKLSFAFIGVKSAGWSEAFPSPHLASSPAHLPQGLPFNKLLSLLPPISAAAFLEVSTDPSPLLFSCPPATLRPSEGPLEMATSVSLLLQGLPRSHRGDSQVPSGLLGPEPCACPPLQAALPPDPLGPSLPPSSPASFASLNTHLTGRSPDLSTQPAPRPSSVTCLTLRF